MIVLVGSSPSSGSTLLADLLDSTDAIACGPETRIFATRGLYDLEAYARDVTRSSKVASIYVRRCALNQPALSSYGLDLRRFREMVDSAEDVAGFASTFAATYLAKRGKRADGIVFEKTPENIHAIGPFLEHVTDGHFIHIVRSPVDVALSLLGREFPPFVAFATWYVDVARFVAYLDHPRCALVRYEDLVDAPFETVASLLATLGLPGLTAAEIEAGYKSNAYRARDVPRPPSWSVRDTDAVRRVERRSLKESEASAFAGLLSMRLDPGYARRFGLEARSFAEVARTFGYEEDVRRAAGAAPAILPRTWKDRRHLGRKWLEDAAKGDAGLRDRASYAHPLIRLEAPRAGR